MEALNQSLKKIKALSYPFPIREKPHILHSITSSEKLFSFFFLNFNGQLSQRTQICTILGTQYNLKKIVEENFFSLSSCIISSVLK